MTMPWMVCSQHLQRSRSLTILSLRISLFQSCSIILILPLPRRPSFQPLLHNEVVIISRRRRSRKCSCIPRHEEHNDRARLTTSTTIQRNHRDDRRFAPGCHNPSRPPSPKLSARNRAMPEPGHQGKHLHPIHV
jgi:hypothetical protein